MPNHPLSMDEAIAVVEQMVGGPAGPIERLPVRAALGRTLAADQISRLDLPPFDKSAMDGYAISATAAENRYRVLETVGAGSVPTASLQPGLTIKVMTGAPVPPGTVKVVPIEHTRQDGSSIEVVKEPRESHICPQGEDVRCGDVVLGAGSRLGPLEVVNLLGCGISQVDVWPRVRIAVLATGDEIVDAPADVTPGKIVNTNGPLLAMLAARDGLDVAIERSVPDDRTVTTRSIAEAVAACDLVVLSGGVSVGDFDFVGRALIDAGLTVHFNSVSIKPGRPLTFASKPGRAVFGLPGNPVSVFLMYHLFVLRAAAKRQGRAWPCRRVTMTLAGEFRRRKAERTEFVPCRITDAGTIAPVEFHGSAHLTALMQAEGFFIVPAGVPHLPAGARADFVRIET